jgi:uncharacterized protein (TIGR01777 family)
VKKVIITGGSGFIGQHIAAALLKKNCEVYILGLHPPKLGKFVRVDLLDKNLDGGLFSGADTIIHLAGTNIFGRWSERKKKLIYESRVSGTRNLVLALEKSTQKPKGFISASAVGFYGNRGDEELQESSLPGTDFLAKVCVAWEKEARQAEKIGLRTVQIRTAPVLGHGGFLGKLLPLYKLGLGGPIGSGRQWFPWIHIKDIADIYVFAMENKQVQGPINACSPERVTNKDFSDTMAKILRRPAFFRMPKWALRLLYNDLADAICASQKVSPKKLANLGYKFSFPNLQGALTNIIPRVCGVSTFI